ncbi:MAG: polysaccharide pyruvyl transferase family protein [Microbacteriaceae bacterium]
MTNIVVCSFYTDDEYYRSEAEALRADLEKLGVDYVLEEIVKEPGQDWADLCRKKVPFLNSVCERFPDSRVFWIDVDCRLLSLPDFVRESSADIIGFQRGFGSALTIGYGNRTRFWEPCFWGVAATPQARRMISEAAAMEKVSTIKATDDYFFEDAWRATADSLTFQLVPSACVVGKGDASIDREAFFVFGSSGNVDEFKGKVVQHTSSAPQPLKKRIINLGKKVLSRMPDSMSRQIVSIADRIGVTGVLTTSSNGGDPARINLTKRALKAGFEGKIEVLETCAAELSASGVPSQEERATIEAARSFATYSARDSAETIPLVWWARPFPGNFGDWLSPMIVGNYTDARITYQPPTAPSSDRHIIALGSIGRFIKPSSVVLGTGISSNDVDLHPKANYVSVRGPITAQLVKECGGPDVESFGDPGAIMSRIVPVDRASTNGRTAFIRHFTHARIPVTVPEHFDELSIYRSNPADITSFILEMARYDRVVTSAMHVFIVCQSYGIPVSLITFEGFEDAVHGSGIKYSDYSQGVGLDPINPAVVPLNLTNFSFASIERDDVVSDGVKDEIEAAVARAIAAVGEKR